MFFFRKEKLIGTGLFMSGIVLVMLHFPIIGILLEGFGITNLFGLVSFTYQLPTSPVSPNTKRDNIPKTRSIFPSSYFLNMNSHSDLKDSQTISFIGLHFDKRKIKSALSLIKSYDTIKKLISNSN